MTTTRTRRGYQPTDHLFTGTTTLAKMIDDLGCPTCLAEWTPDPEGDAIRVLHHLSPCCATSTAISYFLGEDLDDCSPDAPHGEEQPIIDALESRADYYYEAEAAYYDEVDFY